jgi:hypothetical protein
MTTFRRIAIAALAASTVAVGSFAGIHVAEAAAAESPRPVCIRVLNVTVCW